MCANQGTGMRYETGKSMWKERTQSRGKSNVEKPWREKVLQGNRAPKKGALCSVILHIQIPRDAPNLDSYNLILTRALKQS